MATKSATIRVIASLIPDIGEDPTTQIDTGALPVPLPELSGLGAYRVESISLAPAAVDQELLLTEAVAVVIIADAEFSLRLAAGETLQGNLRMWAFQCGDTDAGALTAPILLTGNTISTANLTAIVVERP